MHVGVVGLNHKLADLKLRELLAKTCQRRFGPDSSLHPHHEFILLSTCNRTEVYFSSRDLKETHKYILHIIRQEIQGDFDQKLYSFFDDDCFHHLAKVTAGLDSAIPFETEIQGQVKAAYEKATLYRKLSHYLHYLFQKSLRIGKKVRSQKPTKSGIPDVEQAILNTGQHFFENIENSRLLFVGASNINLKILNFLKTKEATEIAICNRTDKIASQLAEKYQVDTIPWKNLSTWHHYDWVIFGTKSPDYLIQKDGLIQTKCSQKLIIDLSVPRNVDPHLGKHPDVTLLNIDQINRMLKIRKKQLGSMLIEAEQIVTDSSSHLLSLFRKKEEAKELHLASCSPV